MSKRRLLLYGVGVLLISGMIGYIVDRVVKQRRATPAPAPAPGPQQMATAEPSAGEPVSEAEGEWVTSPHPATRYYYHKSDERWQENLKAESNRVWFKTKEELLARFPSRRPAP